LKRSEVKLIVLEIVTLIILLFNIFLKNIFNEYTLFIFLSIIFILSILLVGFEGRKIVNIKKILLVVGLYTLAFLIMIYGLGVLTGYVKNSYNLSIINIFKNTFPYIILIIISELLRYNIIRKANNKINEILAVIIFICIDISLLIHLYNLNNFSDILELTTLVLFPSISKNILLSDLSYKYGYIPCLIYRFILELYIYIIPILPNLDRYLESIIMFLIPIAMKFIINLYFVKKERVDIRKSKCIKVINVALLIFMGTIILLNSNLFPIWVAVVGSGSMTPTINIGDVVIVDKTVQKKLDKLNVGDILVFKIKDSIYTHRIIKIDENNGEYSISTQGDREGNTVDLWTVRNENVVGIVKGKISYIGYPTVWLNQLMEG